MNDSTMYTMAAYDDDDTHTTKFMTINRRQERRWKIHNIAKTNIKMA